MGNYKHSIKLLKAAINALDCEEKELRDYLKRTYGLSTVSKGKASYRLIQISREKYDLEKTLTIISNITWQTELSISRLIGIDIF